jgi:drug/metabolite transporter (DMT)-like permease
MENEAVSHISVLLMLVLVFFWGGSFVVVKIALQEGLTPIALATFRFLIAGCLFVLVLLLKRTRRNDYRLLVDWRDFPMLMLLALTGVTFFFSVQYTGIQMAGASIASILVCLLSPIIIAALSAIIFKEPLTKKQVFGMGVATLGTFIVITGGTVSFQSNPNFILGSLLLLLTPIFWATYTLLGNKVINKYSPFLIVAYVNGFGGLFLIPLSLAENSFHLAFKVSIYGWLAILFLSLACSLIGYYIWFYVIKQLGAAVTSSFMFLQPLVTVLLAVAFVGEKLNLFIVTGGFLTFTGVYLVARR